MRMPFGKYRGMLVEDMPIDYLEWLWENVKMHGRLHDAVCDALSGQQWPLQADTTTGDTRGSKGYLQAIINEVASRPRGQHKCYASH